MTLPQLIADYLRYRRALGTDLFATARSSALSAIVSGTCR